MFTQCQIWGTVLLQQYWLIATEEMICSPQPCDITFRTERHHSDPVVVSCLDMLYSHHLPNKFQGNVWLLDVVSVVIALLNLTLIHCFFILYHLWWFKIILLHLGLSFYIDIPSIFFTDLIYHEFIFIGTGLPEIRLVHKTQQIYAKPLQTQAMTQCDIIKTHRLSTWLQQRSVETFCNVSWRGNELWEVLSLVRGWP